VLGKLEAVNIFTIFIFVEEVHLAFLAAFILKKYFSTCEKVCVNRVESLDAWYNY